ncbi:tetratricopeptide repeat protein [Solitalea lacus]|uniref:tetratricopeptide repeat protein n=1 Tax=Solitalea lacus TaxID=2911172 RepID=UPI001EDB9546|nr:hypothetical protein [Solitalea lacus]UKJ08326.1 hypothetical protein L2B55_03925 [Solitalea lacus]
MRKVLNKVSELLCVFLLVFVSCREKNKAPTSEAINSMNLKVGEIPFCGPADKQFGAVGFGTSCSEKIQKEFELALALLHSFEYDEAEKMFAKVIDLAPDCMMAYWGVAMCNYHPLWAPPSQSELKKGSKAIIIAKSLTSKSKRESDYLDAIASFYKNWDKIDHRTRSLRFEKAMEVIYKEYQNDKEAAIFYALSLIAAANPADKTFENQRKAGSILNELYRQEPNHPGVVHYIIHAYDSPELAENALLAARQYASIAPSSAHALHMPSHIFTRLGLWSESVKSNLESIASAQCYAEQTGIKGHWDEELHGLDYLVYAYLQKGENVLAKKECDYLQSIQVANPVNFKVAYAFAAVPARYLLENKLWKEAAGLQIQKTNVNWNDYPWQRAILHFARLLGSIHIGNLDSARVELKQLNSIHDILVNQKDEYKANQVLIQIKASEAWLLFKEGQEDEALKLLYVAADMEDKTEKHPVTPGEVMPARELLGDMLLQMDKSAEALIAYEADLKKHPNRFNGLYGAGLAAEKSNQIERAAFYYRKLIAIANSPGASRPELEAAKMFIKKKGALYSTIR